MSMATEETTTTAPAAPTAPETPAAEKPVLTDAHKFNIRDLQLKQTTSQVQFQNAAQAARAADGNFRGYIAKLADELKVDVNAWQLNLDKLEFEPRVAPAPPAPNAQPAA